MGVADVLDILDDYGFEDIDESVKVAAIQSAISDAESREPWPFLQTSIALNFDGLSGTPSNWPTNFRASMRAHYLSPFYRIGPVRLDEIDVYMQDQSSLVEYPRLYYIEAGTVKFWPVPPAGTGSIRLRYYRYSAPITAATPSADILLPIYFRLDLLVNGALSKLLFDIDDDPEMSARKEAQYENTIARMSTVLFQQQYDQAESVLVVDPDQWDYHSL